VAGREAESDRAGVGRAHRQAVEPALVGGEGGVVQAPVGDVVVRAVAVPGRGGEAGRGAFGGGSSASRRRLSPTSLARTTLWRAAPTSAPSSAAAPRSRRSGAGRRGLRVGKKRGNGVGAALDRSGFGVAVPRPLRQRPPAAIKAAGAPSAARTMPAPPPPTPEYGPRPTAARSAMLVATRAATADRDGMAGARSGGQRLTAAATIASRARRRLPRRARTRPSAWTRGRGTTGALSRGPPPAPSSPHIPAR
jgi:hypothetical protein